MIKTKEKNTDKAEKKSKREEIQNIKEAFEYYMKDE